MRRQPYDTEFTPQSPWLDLVNSEQWDGFGNPTDHLLDVRWVARFLTYWRPRSRPEPSVPAIPSRLSDLRSLLRRSTERVAGGKPLTPRERRSLNEFLRAPSYSELVEAGDGIRIELIPVRRGWAWVLSRIAASYIDSLGKKADRIKVCANPGCRWAFVDATKGNVRRWCHDRRCGNRDRVRRARAR